MGGGGGDRGGGGVGDATAMAFPEVLGGKGRKRERSIG